VVTTALDAYSTKQRLVDQYLGSNKPQQQQQMAAQLEELRAKGRSSTGGHSQLQQERTSRQRYCHTVIDGRIASGLQ